VLLVSHDRAFLDAVVTQTIASEGDGRWKEYAGGYDDWLRASRAGSAEGGRKPAEGESPARERPRRAQKLSYNETRELEALPARLEAVEAEQKALAAKLADPAIYQDRNVDFKALNERHDALDAELLALLARWEALEAKRA